MATFKKNDRAIIVWGRRRWLVDLSKGKFGTHLGEIDLTQVVGKDEGFSLKLGRDTAFFFKPTLDELLIRVKRQTQIIYPKDISALLLAADVKESDKVLETGTGSGSLLIALLTRVTKGRIVTVEQRPEFQDLAQRNVRRHFGTTPARVRFVLGDVYDEQLRLGLRKHWADRVFLDLPEPWRALHLLRHLRPGGFLAVFNPQIFQLQRVAVAIKDQFTDVSVSEILKRDWLVDEERMRPADVMRGHTGFFLIARKTGVGSVPAERQGDSGT